MELLLEGATPVPVMSTGIRHDIDTLVEARRLLMYLQKHLDGMVTYKPLDARIFSNIRICVTELLVDRCAASMKELGCHNVFNGMKAGDLIESTCVRPNHGYNRAAIGCRVVVLMKYLSGIITNVYVPMVDALLLGVEDHSQRVVATCMGTHPRLAAQSRVYCLTPEIVTRIAMQGMQDMYATLFEGHSGVHVSMPDVELEYKHIRRVVLSQTHV
jgi:hypothetical protein